jgi:lysozyme family protein
MNKFDTAIAKLLTLEGGYVNDPCDSGGETNYGICKRDEPELNIKTLTKQQAIDWYHKNFWLKYGMDHIEDDKLASYWLSMAVNGGISHITKIIQQVVMDTMQQASIFHTSITVDGVPGPQTIKLINEYWKTDKLLNVMEKMWNHYLKIMEAHPEDNKFYHGWHNRCFDTNNSLPTNTFSH